MIYFYLCLLVVYQSADDKLYLGTFYIALVAELAYAHGLGPCPERVRGSNPLGGTIYFLSLRLA